MARRVLRVVDEGTLKDQIDNVLDGIGDALLPVPTPTALDMPAAEYDPSLPSTVPDDVQLVIKTSGSTGNPKLVAHSAATLRAAVEGSAESLHMRATDAATWMLALPTHYIAGVLVVARAAVAGTPVVDQRAAHFDPPEFIELASQQPTDRPLCTSLVPVQLRRLIEVAAVSQEASGILANFHAMLVGGQRLDTATRTAAHDLGLSVITTYGATETAGGCCYNGVPIGLTRVRVVDDRLALGGPSVALGYLTPDGKLDDREAFTERDGLRWYLSQDRGTVQDGRVSVTGRIDTLITRGGIKLDLAEVERWAQLHLHPAAIVAAVPDDTWGQGYVIVTPTSTASFTAVARELVSAFGRHARPNAVIVREIPLLVSGKPDRQRLAKLVDIFLKRHEQGAQEA